MASICVVSIPDKFYQSVLRLLDQLLTEAPQNIWRKAKILSGHLA
jgi:hypothetical protein